MTTSSKDASKLNKLTVNEAMNLIGVGEMVFSRLVKEKKIRIHTLSPKKRFLLLDELTEDLKNMPTL